jgi:hypothetical protein
MKQNHGYNNLKNETYLFVQFIFINLFSRLNEIHSGIRVD